MRALRLSPRAASDLQEIGDYIARDNPARAASFVDELHDACRRIVDSPEAYPLRTDIAPGVRTAIFGYYLILFRISAEEVRVERVLHGARDLPRAFKD